MVCNNFYKYQKSFMAAEKLKNYNLRHSRICYEQ